MMTLMVEAAVRALLAAVLVGAGIWVLRVRNVVAQKVAWVMALGAALLMPLIMHRQILPSVAMPQIFTTKSVPVQRDVARANTRTIFIKPQSAGSVAAFHADVPATRATVPEINRQESVQRQLPQWRNFNFLLVAEAIYFVVLVALLLRLALGSLAALRLWMRAKPVSAEELPLLADGSAVRSVRESERVHSPVTIGTGIVLPANFRSWPEEKLRVVLLHEESHVRQCDFYLQFAAGAHAAVFWFSPLGWWLKRKLAELSETISDGAALSAASDATTYAQVLLDFAAGPRLLFAGVAMARNSNLANRIERLLNEGQFKTAFAEGRVRMYLAGVLVPLAMMVVTLHVQAAGQQNSVGNTQDQTTTVLAQPTTDQVQLSAPSREEKQELNQLQAPAMLLARADRLGTTDDNQLAATIDQDDAKTDKKHTVFNYSINDDGDSWALIEGHQSDTNLMLSDHSGPAIHEQFEKARKMANGDFFWFTRGGKSYVVDDPATIKELDGLMSSPHPVMLGPDGKKLKQNFFFTTDGKDGDLVLTSPDDKNPNKIIIRDKDLNVKVNVDVEKQMAAVQEALKKVEGKLNKEEFADLEARMSELEVKLSKIHTDVNVDVNADVEAALMNMDKVASGIKLQTDLKILDDDKVKAIIEESLKNGKARPVE
jgi:beta-lactamase regulating signal transducer with metallopeptidase domain